jgi:hypothetical protein
VQYTKCVGAFRPAKQTKGKPKELERQQKVKGKKIIRFFYMGKGFILKPF